MCVCVHIILGYKGHSHAHTPTPGILGGVAGDSGITVLGLWPKCCEFYPGLRQLLGEKSSALVNPSRIMSIAT